MALAATSVMEINAGATANNVNGGGFNPSNAGMLTDLTTDANTANTNSPVVSSASYNFVASDVGNWVYVKSGTNWTPGWYQIASVAANKATLSAAVGQAVQTSAIGNPNPKYGANTVLGCATVGTPTAGTFTIDYSQSTSCITSTSVSDYASVGSSTTMTSSTAAFTPVMVGNFFHLNNSGTGAHGVIGWYEVATYSNGTTVTTDRTTNDGTAMVAGQGKIGGALSMNSTLDDDVFEISIATAGTGAFHWFMKKNGNVSLGEAVSIGAAGQAREPIILEGYNALRGDAPTGTSRPTLDANTTSFAIFTSYWRLYNLLVTSTGTPTFDLVNKGLVAVNTKFTNTSTTAGRHAFSQQGNGIAAVNCEMISYRGNCIIASSGPVTLHACYMHDSDTGCYFNASAISLSDCIIADNVTYAVRCATSDSSPVLIKNNTICGASATPIGTGMAGVSSTGDYVFENNILYGFVTGALGAEAQHVHYGDYNNYYNNTADLGGFWQKGSHDIALDPGFTDFTQISGINATVSGSNLSASGTQFSTCEAGVDFINLISGTGATAGKYLITAVNAGGANIDLSSAPGGSGTNIVWRCTTGHDFRVGTNMKGVGWPGLFPGADATCVGALDIGSVQRQEPASAPVGQQCGM